MSIVSRFRDIHYVAVSQLWLVVPEAAATGRIDYTARADHQLLQLTPTKDLLTVHPRKDFRAE